MSDINITVEGNSSKRLKTAGKYCDRDIVITAKGGEQTYFLKSLIRRGIGFIDTGVDGANSDLSIEIRYEFLTLPTAYFNLLHSYTNETTNATRITYNKHNVVYVCLNSVPNKSLTHTWIRYANVVYTDIVTPASGTTFSYTTNGIKNTQTRTSGSITAGKNIILFPKSTSDDKVSLKIYYLKIYDGDTLIRDYVPFVNLSGEVGLYDNITNQFYGNDGNGTFEAENF